MFEQIKRFLLILSLLTMVTGKVEGFSITQPPEPWQTAVNGFTDTVYNGAPANLGNRFRYNIGTLYYAADATYVSYFGVNGLTEMDKAFNVFNALTNYSAIKLSAVSQNTSRLNGTAQALNLYDIKSAVMSGVCRTLGMLPPENYVWCLHDRFVVPGITVPCPNNMGYTVVQRNYDPETMNYSSYIDGQLYTFGNPIQEFCTGPPPLATANVRGVDPSKTSRSLLEEVSRGTFGLYYQGLSRDEIGALKYLMSSNIFLEEGTPQSSQQIVTNGQTQIFYSQSLSQLYAAAITNPPAALQLLYPALSIISSTAYFTNVFVTNTTLYLTNPIGAPYGYVSNVTVTTITTVPQTNYSYVFGNVQILHSTPTRTVTTILAEYATRIGGLANVFYPTTQTIISTINQTNGDFILIPSDFCGGVTILSTNATNVVGVTNVVNVATNGVIFGTTPVFIVGETNISFETTYNYIVQPITCLANSTSIRAGVDKVKFIRRDFDSLLGTLWTPVTNTYKEVEIIGGVVQTNSYIRVVTRPDVLLSTEDVLIGPASVGFIHGETIVGYSYDTSHQQGTHPVGPGVLNPANSITLDTQGSFYLIEPGPYATPQLFPMIWGSFDGSTNAPIVYPSTTSLNNLANQLYLQITNVYLPTYSLTANYTTANPYSVRLGASGGAAPYTWSILTNTPPVPGLILTNIAGVQYLRGVGPSAAAPGTTYDFYLQVKDSSGTAVFKSMFLVVNP